jgi:hypothetical protein
MSKKVKIFAIVVGIIIVVILGFTYFGGDSTANTGVTSSDGGLTTTAGTTGTVPGGSSAVAPAASTNSFAATLSTISGITLDTSIFSNAGYRALRDYPVNLGTAVIGRQNPFAPIGADGSAGNINAAAAVQVQTLAPGKILSTTAELGALVSTTTTTPTTVVFQYGTSDTLGQATAPIKVTQNGTALFTITGLTPATTYYVEAVAVQGSSTATGTIMSFTTAAKPSR